MDFIDINIIKYIGISILHSTWQIAIVTLIYFYFILTKNRIKVKYKYTAGLTCLLVAFIVFIATTFLIVDNGSSEIAKLPHGAVNNATGNFSLLNIQENILSEANYYTSSSWTTKIKLILNNIATIIGAIWIIGLTIVSIRKVSALKNLQSLKNNKHNVGSVKWENSINEISKKLKLKKHVNILFSPFISSPLSFGILKPVILFPLRLTTGLSDDEIKCILIHELAHNLKNHHLHNIFQNSIETIFFYHPGILWISKQIRLHREIICDEIVLETEISEKYYANTLLKLCEMQVADSNLAIAAKRSEKELLTRIKYIFGKNEGSIKHKPNSYTFIAALLIAAISCFVILQKNRKTEPIALSDNIIENLSPFEGSFALYDFNNDSYYYLNDSLCNVQFPAFSTFKIASTLFAFDMGIANDELFSMDYDSIKHPLPASVKGLPFYQNWCKTQNMVSALDYSVNWFYMELDEKIGRRNMQSYLEKANYGNMKLSSTSEPAWYNGELKTSTIEQVDFLKALANQDINHISKNAQALTKNIIPHVQKDNYTIYGKTGTGDIATDKYIGWYVGYLETNGKTYAFALNIFADEFNKLIKSQRHNIVESIFIDMELINK